MFCANTKAELCREPPKRSAKQANKDYNKLIYTALQRFMSAKVKFQPFNKKEFFTAKNLLSWVVVTIGVVVMSAGFALFTNPYKIIPGGVYGLGRVLHDIFPSIPTGTFGFMFDIPLMIIGLLVFGGSFGAKTIYAALISPLVMNGLTRLVGEGPLVEADYLAQGKEIAVSWITTSFNFANDPLMAAIFGGLLIGAGVGIIIRGGATSGGTDIVSMIISKFCKMKFSTAMVMVESTIVVIGMLRFQDWQLPLYSLISIYVSSKAVDMVLDGATYEKLLFVISEKNDAIKHYILEELGRGGTYIKSSGMYTDKDRDMIFLVVSRKEIAAVKSKLHDIDEKSFVVVVDAHETYGDGFKKFELDPNTNA